MLISFTVGNFRSFKEEQTLNMVASNKLQGHPVHMVDIPGTDKKVLRCAVLYGANAAGKSNLVQAIRVARDIIFNPKALRSISPFMSNRKEVQPSTFEFQFATADYVFSYGFDATSKQISAEWLTVRRGEKDEVLFDRKCDGTAETQGDAGAIFQEDRSSAGNRSIDVVLAWLTSQPLRPDELLLNRAVGLPKEAQGEVLGAISDWFAKSLVVYQVGHRAEDLFDRLEDPHFCAFVSKFLCRVGTGVDRVAVMKGKRDATVNEMQVNRVNHRSKNII